MRPVGPVGFRQIIFGGTKGNFNTQQIRHNIQQIGQTVQQMGQTVLKMGQNINQTFILSIQMGNLFNIADGSRIFK